MAGPASKPAPEDATPSGPCAQEAYHVDTSQVADPLVKEAIDAIEDRLNAIVACSFTVRTVDTVAIEGAPPQETILEAECRFRWPCAFAVEGRYVASGLPGQTGTLHKLRTEGMTFWDVTLGTEASRVALAELKLSDRARTALLERQAAPFVKSAPFSSLTDGTDAALRLSDTLFWVRAPFASCDVPTLRLEAADDSGWTFSARPAAVLAREFDRVTLHVDAANGIATETLLRRPNNGGSKSRSIRRVNLDPVLSDADFVYEESGDPGTPGKS